MSVRLVGPSPPGVPDARGGGTVLCCPATSVVSERVFSKAGDVITKKRNALAPSKAQKLVFLMENL